MFLSFLSHPLHGVAFFKVSLHTYFTVRFMLFLCAITDFADIIVLAMILMTYPW